MPDHSESEISTPSSKAMTTREMHRALDTHSLKPFDVAESIRFCLMVNDLAEHVHLIPLPFDPFAVGLCYLESKESEFCFVLANGQGRQESEEAAGVIMMVGADGGTNWTKGPEVSSLADALRVLLTIILRREPIPACNKVKLLKRLQDAAQQLAAHDLELFIDQLESLAISRCSDQN